MGGRWKGWVIAVLVLLLAAGVVLLQAGLDDTAAGTPANIEQGGWSPESSLLQFLGGVRQFIAYELYNKADDIHDSYYGSLDEPELVPYFRIITWLDPHFTRAYYIGSGILYLQNKPEPAIDFTREGLRNNPGSADLHYSLGGLLFATGRYAEAIPPLEEAVSEEPDVSDPLLTLLTLEAAYEKTGRIQDAIDAYDQAIQLLQFLLAQPDVTPEDMNRWNTAIADFTRRKAELEQQL